MNKNVLDSISKKTENKVEYLVFLARYSDSFNIFKINDIFAENYKEISFLKRKRDQTLFLGTNYGEVYILESKLISKRIQINFGEKITCMIELNDNLILVSSLKGNILVLNTETEKIIFKTTIFLSKNEQIIEFILDSPINKNSNFLEFYCITSFGKIYFIKKGITVIDTTLIIDCCMEIQTFVDYTKIILIGKSHIYLIEEYKKITDINMKNFANINENDIYNMYTFLIQNEIVVFYEDKLIIIEMEFYEVCQCINLDFTVIFVKKGKTDFLILGKYQDSHYLFFLKLDELKRQDFLFKEIYHINFDLQNVKDIEIWNEKNGLPIVILLKNGECYILDYFINVLNLCQKLEKPKEDIQQRNNDNQDYDSDSEFKSFLIFKQNFNIKTIEKIDDKMLYQCAKYNVDFFCKVIKNMICSLDTALTISKQFHINKGIQIVYQKMGKYFESIEYLCSKKLYDKAITVLLKKKSFISEFELIKIYDYLYFLLKNERKFILALNKFRITLDEIFINIKFRQSLPIIDLFQNKKVTVMEKAEYLSENFHELKLMRNILELAIVSYRTEFQKNEKKKFKSNTKGFLVGKANFLCYKCGKKTRDLNGENEEIVVFPNCNHFLHMTCADTDQSEEFYCKKCLKNNNSENKKYKY